MKTVAEQIKWDFKTNGNLQIRDKNSNLIYFEDSKRYRSKWEYDSQGNLIYYENSKGDWRKWEFDSQGNQIYYEDSNGQIRDNRPKSYEGKIVEFKGLGLLSMFEPGVKYKLVKV